MKIRYSPIASQAFADATPPVQKAFLKQAAFLQPANRTAVLGATLREQQPTPPGVGRSQWMNG